MREFYSIKEITEIYKMSKKKLCGNGVVIGFLGKRGFLKTVAEKKYTTFKAITVEWIGKEEKEGPRKGNTLTERMTTMRRKHERPLFYLVLR